MTGRRKQKKEKKIKKKHGQVEVLSSDHGVESRSGQRWCKTPKWQMLGFHTTNGIKGPFKLDLLLQLLGHKEN
jgi:hypothetical protein